MISQIRVVWATACVALLALGGCASRPVNPPITQVDPNGGYTFQTRQKHFKSRDTLVVLAFSGGGTRAAAFSYGVLEFLQANRGRGTGRRQASSARRRRHDHRRVGRQLHRAGLRPVRRQAVRRLRAALSQARRAGRTGLTGPEPRTIGATYIGGTAGRSELAANYYDEILFNGATFGDLDRGDGPFIVASATDISTGTRVPFQPGRLQPAVHGSQCRAAVARRIGIVGGSGGAVHCHPQQLRRHLQLRGAGLGQDVHHIRRIRRGLRHVRYAS